MTVADLEPVAPFISAIFLIIRKRPEVYIINSKVVKCGEPTDGLLALFKETTLPDGKKMKILQAWLFLKP